MEKSLLYLHGYNSNGNAFKAQQLHAMFPKYKFIAPTFYYKTTDPHEVLQQIVDIAKNNDVRLAVGSSTGGYYSLLLTAFVDVPVLAVNPVTDSVALFKRMVTREQDPVFYDQFLPHYQDLQTNVFEKLPLPNKNINLALALDDDLLGSHEPTKQRFANCGRVIEMDNCGHHFTRFGELKPFIELILNN